MFVSISMLIFSVVAGQLRASRKTRNTCNFWYFLATLSNPATLDGSKRCVSLRQTFWYPIWLPIFSYRGMLTKTVQFLQKMSKFHVFRVFSGNPELPGNPRWVKKLRLNETNILVPPYGFLSATILPGSLSEQICPTCCFGGCSAFYI